MKELFIEGLLNITELKSEIKKAEKARLQLIKILLTQIEKRNIELLKEEILQNKNSVKNLSQDINNQRYRLYLGKDF